MYNVRKQNLTLKIVSLGGQYNNIGQVKNVVIDVFLKCKFVGVFLYIFYCY